MEKETKIMFDIYRQMYKEATPSVDFDVLMEEAAINERGQKVIDYMAYSLAQNRQDEIIEEHLKGNRLTNIKKQMIRNYALLGASPKSI